MTLEGAINFNETNEYAIYTMNSTTAGQYCVVLPKNSNGTYNMLVDLHMKSLFDEVNAGTKSKDDLVGEIGKEYNNVKTKYNDAILVIPMLDEVNYVNIINTNDKQKMFDEVKKIGAITSELYKKLTEGGLDKQRIDQKIIILEKNDYDKKFVEWLIGQMPNFVSGIDMNEFSASNDNPFMSNEVNTTNDIFGAPVVDNSNVVPVASENNPPVQENNVVENNMVEPQVVAPVQEPVVEQPVAEEAVAVPDIFGTPVQQPVVNEVPVVDVPVQQPVQEPVQPVQEAQTVAEPKPVQSVELEQTVTFSPVNNENTTAIPVQQPVQQPVENNGVIENNANADGSVGGEVVKKSNGFVNLAILLVILVGVTLISIELGKFLYNTYGV